MSYKWTNNMYQQLINELYSMGNDDYKNFHSGLGINKDYLIGIPVPKLKKIAKYISKADYISFIKLNTHNTYEERLIHGLLIGYIKDNFDNILTLSKEYLPYIDNWALCDVFVANLHIFKNNTKHGLTFVKWCLNHKNTWYKRVGYVILISYYIKEDYIDIIFKLCDQNNSDEYYVKMAIAWLISICYIKQPIYTQQYLKHNKLDIWTHNKAIQKIRESKKVSKKEKDDLLKWKK